MTHICVGNLIIIGSDNGLSPGWRQAIIWTNAGILLIEPLGTNFSEILIEILTFSFKKMRLKVSSAKWRPFCLGLNVLSDPGKAFKFPKQFGIYLNADYLRFRGQLCKNSLAQLAVLLSQGRWAVGYVKPQLPGNQVEAESETPGCRS